MGSTLLEPMVVEHMPEYAEAPQRCRECGKHTFWFCPGCAKADDCGPASGFYCVHKDRKCFAASHRRRARTKVEGEGSDEGGE